MDEIKELFELAKKEFSYKLYEELGAPDEVKDATEMIVDELSYYYDNIAKSGIKSWFDNLSNSEWKFISSHFLSCVQYLPTLDDGTFVHGMIDKIKVQL